jgi:hypothetical protein
MERGEIVRDDFPVAREGWEPAAVTAHLERIATTLAAIEPARGQRAASAAERIETLLKLAEREGEGITADARSEAERITADARIEGERLRQDARSQVEQTRGSAADLLARVEELRGEISELQAELARELAAASANLAELDSQTGRPR